MVVPTTTTMHTKSDSEVTSIEASTPPRSPRRPLYYVQSPSHSHQDLEKMSFRSTPFASPTHHHFHYHSSPIHHSRESSTSRYASSNLKTNNNNNKWLRMQRKYNEVGDNVEEEEKEEGDVDGDDDENGGGGLLRFYAVCFVLSFVVLFTAFSFIIWGSSLSYKPKILVKSISFENFNVQAGMDSTGVPTDMLTMNSTVKIFYRNPATFFGVHVTSTSLELHYFDLQVATGHIEKFYQSRKSQRIVTALVHGHQVPLYGGIPMISAVKSLTESISVPLNLTFALRSRAYVLGRLVKPTFYRSINCQVTLRGNHLGKPLNLTKADSCVYH